MDAPEHVCLHGEWMMRFCHTLRRMWVTCLSACAAFISVAVCFRSLSICLCLVIWRVMKVRRWQWVMRGRSGVFVSVGYEGQTIGWAAWFVLRLPLRIQGHTVDKVTLCPLVCACWAREKQPGGPLILCHMKCVPAGRGYACAHPLLSAPRPGFLRGPVGVHAVLEPAAAEC